MKFRHFEFRLFPKLKSKRKKKQKKCNPDFPRDIGLDKNYNYSNPGYYAYYDNLGADDTITGGPGKIYKDVICSTDDGCLECSCTHFTTYPLPELTISVEDACDCGCETGSSCHVTCAGSSCGERSARETPETPSTIPRTRTRIKTNPWLPSPKTTPAPSPTETANSIVLATTELTIPYRYPLTFDDSSGEDNIPSFGPSRLDYVLDHETLEKDSDAFHSVIKVSETVSCSREKLVLKLDKLDTCVDGKESLPEADEATDRADDTISHIYTMSNFTYAQFLTYDSSATSTPDTDGYRTIGCTADIPEFEYESKTNELLETVSIPRDDSFGTAASLETAIGLEMAKETDIDKQFDKTACTQAVLSNCLSISENVQTTSYTDKSSEPQAEARIPSSDPCKYGNHSNEDLSPEEGPLSSTADWTFCDSHMQTSTDTGYGSISRDTDSITSTDEILETAENKSEDGLEWDNEPSAHNLLYNFYQEKQKLLMSQSLYNEKELMCNNKRSRSLADIEMSLDEKVSRLRAEKLYVQMKIREAIEEEIIRRRQLRQFRSVSPDNRKELLVKTLHDLKARLENQSARLQTSYDTVLSLQRRFSERRNGPKMIETSI